MVKSDVDPSTVFWNLKKVGEGSGSTVYAYLYRNRCGISVFHRHYSVWPQSFTSLGSISIIMQVLTTRICRLRQGRR